jgi:hypothetical protein
MSIYFSLFIELSIRSTQAKLTRSHSAKYQNIVTLEKERRALGSWYFSNQLQWLGFGFPIGPWAKTGSNAWTALHHPFTIRLDVAKAKVRSSVSCYSLRVPCFSLPCKLYISLRLPKSISEYLLAQPLAC